MGHGQVGLCAREGVLLLRGVDARQHLAGMYAIADAQIDLGQDPAHLEAHVRLLHGDEVSRAGDAGCHRAPGDRVEVEGAGRILGTDEYVAIDQAT